MLRSSSKAKKGVFHKMVAYTMNFEQMKAGIKTGYIKKFTRHCDLKIQPLTVFRGLGYNKCN